MMMRNRVNYEEEINHLVAQDASRQALFTLVRNMVDVSGREGGTLAFNTLNRALSRSLPEHTEEVVLDVLDALSGQCHGDCCIGTGNYHLAHQTS